MNTKLTILLILIAYNTTTYSAVHVSPNNKGDAIIVPMYTVSNEMNTLLSINNTTDENKAVKVHFKEARYGEILASFNVYLTGQDIWTMTTARIDGKIKMKSTDLSCTTGFPNYPENITVYNRWLWENGTIEIIEMGTFSDLEALQGNQNDCSAIKDFWKNSQMWDVNSEEKMFPATGGLHADVTFMNVVNGHTANIPLLHLKGFYGEDNIQHTKAGNRYPDLSTGTHDSLVFNKGQAIRTTWPTGFEAISALMTKKVLHNEYENIYSLHTNWIISFPTLNYHKNNDLLTPFVPYRISDQFPYSGIKLPGQVKHFGFKPYLRDSQTILFEPPCGGTIACPKWSNIKHSVISYLLKDTNQDNSITDIHAENTFEIDFDNTFFSRQPGKIELHMYNDSSIYSYSENNLRGYNSLTRVSQNYQGLPVIGFAYTIQNNFGAQPGKLTNYAQVKKNFGHAFITE